MIYDSIFIRCKNLQILRFSDSTFDIGKNFQFWISKITFCFMRNFDISYITLNILPFNIKTINKLFCIKRRVFKNILCL